MKLKIKVCTDNSCKIVIRDDTEFGGQGYVPESSNSVAPYVFKYSETVAVDVLVLNKTEGPETQIPIYTDHNEQIVSNDLDPNNIKPGMFATVLPVKFDGWFTAYHIVVPSKAWFEKEFNKTAGSTLSLYDAVYYSDGQGFYKYLPNEGSFQVSIDEVIERNIEKTTISREEKNYVSICFLKKCYISLCQQIFNSKGFSQCWNKNSQSSDLAYKRDLVWMAINVIKYLTQFNQLAEVQRIIESIGGCNGLCKSEFKQLSSHGCGCSK